MTNPPTEPPVDPYLWDRAIGATDVGAIEYAARREADKAAADILRDVSVPDDHIDSLVCPCGPVAGPDGILLHTLEGGPVSLLPAPPSWVFVQTGPTTFEWVREGAAEVPGATITGADLIAAERRRQVMVEGYTAEHDRRHGSATLRGAAWSYQDPGSARLSWPDGWEFKPRNALANLVRAGALFEAAAEVADWEAGRGRPVFGGAALARRERDNCARMIDDLLNEARAILGGSTVAHRDMSGPGNGRCSCGATADPGEFIPDWWARHKGGGW